MLYVYGGSKTKRWFSDVNILDLQTNTWSAVKVSENKWRAQSKNDPLIFRPFLKVSTCQNSTTSEHFQKWPKNQGIVLALSPPNVNTSLYFIS